MFQFYDFHFNSECIDDRESIANRVGRGLFMSVKYVDDV